MKEVKITVIGGGSTLWSPLFARDFGANQSIMGTITLYDLNREAAERAAQLYEMYNVGGRWEIEVADSLEKALDGPDFVVFTINAGGMAGTQIDLEVPARYGIIQTVGDTVGAGGISRAIRNCPEINKVADYINLHCPDAWLINCSNPMTLMVMSASRYHDKVVGYCHEWQHIEKWIQGLASKLGWNNPKLRPLIFGLNHFSAALEVREVVSSRECNTMGSITEMLPVPWMSEEDFAAMNPFDNHRQLTRKLAEETGVLPIAGDRHLVEFLPMGSPEQLRELLIGVTTIEHRLSGIESARDQYQRWLNHTEALTEGHSLEEIDYIIAALAGFGEYETNLIVPESPIVVPGYDHRDVPWEMSCVVSEGQVVPVPELHEVVARKFDGYYARLTVQHTYELDLISDAIADRKSEPLVWALENDPHTAFQTNGQADLRSLVEELVTANSDLMQSERRWDR